MVSGLGRFHLLQVRRMPLSFSSTEKYEGHTQLAIASVIAVVAADLWLLRTRMVTRKVFWTAYAIVLFFQLISRRYERGPMILTSNQSFGAWGEVFGDRVIATAILDRLLHHAHIVPIAGESYRLKHQRHAGALPVSEGEKHKKT